MTTQVAALRPSKIIRESLAYRRLLLFPGVRNRAAKSIEALFNMGETGTPGCHGLHGVSNTTRALFWEIDYTLFGAIFGRIGFFP